MWVMDCSVLKCHAFIPVAWACTAARGGLLVMILYYRRALSARSMWLYNTILPLRPCPCLRRPLLECR